MKLVLRLQYTTGFICSNTLTKRFLSTFTLSSRSRPSRSRAPTSHRQTESQRRQSDSDTQQISLTRSRSSQRPPQKSESKKQHISLDLISPVSQFELQAVSVPSIQSKHKHFDCQLFQFVRFYSQKSERIITSQTSVSKKQIMAAKNMHSTDHVKQNYDFFLVLDFEATCDKLAQPNPQEIIEFPVLKVNATTMKVDSIFHQYVRPQFHPQLTTFCTELTGIIQTMVDNQPHLPEVLQSFHEWMGSEGLLHPNTKSIFVTCGDWDLKTMLPKQCAFLDLSIRPYFRQWINIKKSFADVTSVFPKGMMVMLNNLNLKHVGTHHSGIDDCHNIANVLIALMHRGYIFKQNSFEKLN